MASGTPAAWHRDVGILFEAGTLTGLSDRDLIERFSGPREAAAEAAFEALVTRHGPMVLRVCRNVLSNPDDADDAFQATFLVLVKQRSSIRKLDSVASWLYGVAARVSARARVDAARRRKKSRPGSGSRPVPTSEPATRNRSARPSGPSVQDEVRRLPEKYRSVVLLCYWEGLTQEQAAAAAGLSDRHGPQPDCPGPRPPAAQAHAARPGVDGRRGGAGSRSFGCSRGGLAFPGSPRSGPILRRGCDACRGRSGDRRGGLGRHRHTRSTHPLEHGDDEAEEPGGVAGS